jgi:hypothetical protein
MSKEKTLGQSSITQQTTAMMKAFLSPSFDPFDPGVYPAHDARAP